MNIPNLPTDNLYKFLSLAGIVVVIMAVYFTVTKVSEVSDKIMDVQEGQDIVSENIKSLERLVELLEKIVDNSIAELKGERKKDDKKLELVYSESEIKNLMSEIRDSLAKIGVEKVRVEANTKRLTELHERSKKISHWGVFFIAIGMIMANFGFYLWYTRVQKPLDCILKRELLIKKYNNSIQPTS